ncbi:general stress protein [Corynebacterium sp. ZY180755]
MQDDKKPKAKAMSAELTQRKAPEGWPVGSFTSYSQAQAAVDMLSDNEFPVEDITIVGVDLMEVERVTGRLTWGRVLVGGAASGAWLGLFFGLILGIITASWSSALFTGVLMGVIFGLITAAASYGLSGGRRDFSSSTQIVAGRYDIICHPMKAREARDRIAEAVREGKLTV